MKGPFEESVKSKFTDDDLKRLKDNLRPGFEVDHDTLKALLARLEAAERIICSYSKFDYDEDRKLLVKKWLQSKGVEGA